MPTDMKPNPRFRLLDVVVAWPDAPNDVSRKGTVIQVRQYEATRFVYTVAPLDPNEVATVFDEDDLVPTTERSAAETFTTFGRFRTRDIVRVSSTSPTTEVAGRTGVVHGGWPDDDSWLLVWIDDLEEVWAIAATDLIPTGNRLPPGGRRTAHSLKVSQEGAVLGSDAYVVLEDVDDL